MNRLPWLLIYLRLALAPAILVAALLGAPGSILVAVAALALLTDVLDGVIARRLGVDTEVLRHRDSQVDTIFYFAAAVGLFIRFPDVWLRFRPELLSVLFFEVIRMLFEWRKFGRPAAYHMWSAKLWGLVMMGCFAEVALTGSAGPMMLATIFIGIYTNIEGLMASIILPKPYHDVPTWLHAMVIARTGQEHPVAVRRQ